MMAQGWRVRNLSLAAIACFIDQPLHRGDRRVIFELGRLAASLTFDRAAQTADLFGARADRGYNVAEEVYPG